jgi:hypothetical protein
MNFVTRWVMLVKQELVMSLTEMEGTEVMEDEGNSEDPSQFWELRSFWTFWNICLTSILKLYLTEIIQILLLLTPPSEARRGYTKS